MHVILIGLRGKRTKAVASKLLKSTCEQAKCLDFKPHLVGCKVNVNGDYFRMN